MKGIINYYLNFRPDDKDQPDMAQTIETIKTFNKEVFDKIRAEGYYITFIPTTGEACRVEKVEFDQPFEDPKE